MSVSRLSTIAPDLVDQLRSIENGKRFSIAAKVARFAVDKSGLAHSFIDEALSTSGPSSHLRSKMETLVQELDSAYFDLQDEADNGEASKERVLEAFSTARAANAVSILTGDDSPESAEESIYESCIAVGDLNSIRRLFSQCLK